MTDARRDPRSDAPDDDSPLTVEAERMLAREVDEARGRDPARAADPATCGVLDMPTTGHSALISNRALLVITFATLVVVGVIVSLASGSWWAVVAAAGVHALGTLVVATVTLRMTGEVEHMAPETAARLEDEGVGDPDRILTDLIEREAMREQSSGGAGRNTVSTEPRDDPVRADVEQRFAMTPAGSPVRPAKRGAPAVLPIVAVAGSLALAIAVGVVMGGAAWVIAGGVAVVSIAWLLLMRRAAEGSDEGTGDEPEVVREPGGTGAGADTRLVAAAAVLVAAVVAGAIIVGTLGGYLDIGWLTG